MSVRERERERKSEMKKLQKWRFSFSNRIWSWTSNMSLQYSVVVLCAKANTCNELLKCAASMWNEYLVKADRLTRNKKRLRDLATFN